MPDHVIATPADKWRYTCPEGHNDWRCWDGRFGCRTCQRHRNGGRDVPTVYEHLIDLVTGEEISREDIRIEHQPARTSLNP